jgi:superfamily I DNA/RNA helicase
MAVAYIDGPLLVLAGAGSGKTSVITHKIAYLIQKCGYEAKHIAAVTFTNKASREMKERVDQLLSGPGARELKVNTFHQLGLGIIRREHKALGLKPGFSIFDNQDSQTLIKDILLQEHGNDGGQSDFIQQQISNWKNDAISPEDAIAQAYGPAEILCSQTYQRYNHALRAYNALDFDDLILRPSQLFQQQPEILIKWQQRIRYVLVDEYQDTNGSDEEAEAEQVVAEILDHKLRHQSELADYAILYRGNHQSRRLELCLQSHQVAYTISEGTSFFAHNEIKDIMAYLKLLINPDDDNAFLRIANTPRRKIGTTTLETLVEYAHRQEFSLHAACSEISQQQISESAVMRLRKFRLWLDDVARNCEYYNPVEAIRKMIDNMDYYGWIDQNSSSTAITERRIANVELLIVSLAQVLQQDEGSTIQDAIGRLVLHDLLEQQEEESDGAGVQLMTLHASKGLEFPHVYLVGMEEELLPHRVSIKEDNIEEERRLAYVGITRAQETLTMTFANKRKQFGGSVDCESSRFLDELPREDILWLGNNSEQSRSQNQDRGLQTISSLQDLFS